MTNRFLSAFDELRDLENTARPRVFIRPASRARLADLPARDPEAWQRLARAADASAAHARASLDAAAALGLAYLISGRAEYRDRLVEHTEAALGVDDWVHPTHRPGGNSVDLGVAHYAARIGLAYDLLYENLSSEQRERWRHALVARALALFLPAHRGGGQWWARVTHNWRAVICGEMGIAAMALMGEWPHARESLRESVAGVLATLEANPDDGSYVEGVSYWSYGIGRTAWFAEALRAFTDGAVDLFQHPFLQRTADFALYLTTPDLACFNFADCSYRPPWGVLLSLLAARTGNPYAQHLADQLDSSHPLDLLWREDAPAPRPPDDLPTVKHFPVAGATVIRSDWSDEAVYLGLKTGETTANHSHLDINSFVLNAFGKPLLVDVGSWTYDHGGGFFHTTLRRWDYAANATLGHSTLLVDGEGQRCGPDHNGRLAHLEATAEFTYAVAEGAAAYGPELHRFDRHFLLAPEGYLILLDDVVTDRDRQLAWHFQPAGSVDLKRLAEDRIRIVNQPAALHLDVLSPSPEAGRTVKQVSLTSQYVPAWNADPALTQHGFSYLSIAPLHRCQEARLALVLQPRKAAARPAPRPSLNASAPDRVEILVPSRRRKTRWIIDPRERKVERG